MKMGSLGVDLKLKLKYYSILSKVERKCEKAWILPIK